MTDRLPSHPPSAEEPRPSRDWHSLIEERIAKLDLDNLDLPGKGKPLDLAPNPYGNPDQELAHRVLKNAGYTLPWIEEGKRIDAQLEAARLKLGKARDHYLELRDAQICAGHQWVEGEWQAALGEFRSQVEALNRQIRDYNLKVTLPNLQKFPVRIEEELSRMGVEG